MPLWDCALVIETEQCATGIRACTTNDISADKLRRVKNSVPGKAFDRMKKRQATCVMTYNLKGNMWYMTSWDIRDTSVPAIMSETLQGHEGAIIAAWNMKSHDRHVLAASIDTPTMEKYTLSDPLIDFRKRIGLPKNSMANIKEGTPRHVFSVSHSYMGPSHTSIVDTLNMRLVCLRAFHNIQAAQGDKKALAVRLANPTSVQCEGVPVAEQFNAAFDIMSESVLEKPESGWEPVTKIKAILPVIGWMWEDKYWKPRKLDTRMKGEFIQRLRIEARKLKPNGTLSAEESEMINTVKTEVDVQKCVEQLTS